jgi:hypothetical protein
MYLKVAFGGRGNRWCVRVREGYPEQGRERYFTPIIDGITSSSEHLIKTSLLREKEETVPIPPALSLISWVKYLDF